MRLRATFMVLLLFGFCTAAFGSLQETEFATPLDKESLDYLGLNGASKTFTLSQVNGDILVIEVFKTDCYFCRKEAPSMVQLYDLVKSGDYRERIKIIGIGATNVDPEINQYKKHFKIPFPLLADPEYKSYGFIGKLEIPSISVFKRDDKGKWQYVYSKSRERRGAEAILKDILSASGLPFI